MKKIISLITSGALVAPVLGVIACGNDPTESTVAKWNETYEPPTFGGTKLNDKKLVSVVSDPENPRWQKAKTEIENSGKEVFSATTANILKTQAEQNNWLITNKDNGDGYLIGATDNSISEFINDVPTKPVVAYDRLIDVVATNYNWYVTFDNSKVGYLQGISILSNLYNKDFSSMTEADIIAHVEANQLENETGLISVAGDPADNNAGLFFNGAKDIIEKAQAKDSNLKWYGSSVFSENAQAKWDYNKGQEHLTTTITALDGDKKNNIKAVLSPNDGMAESAIAALNSQGLNPEEIYITGQDSNDTALNNIEDNQKQNMTIFKPDAQAARLGVAMVANLVDGNTSNDDEDGMKAYLETAYPNISFTIQFGSASTYKADEGETSEKPINTVLLTPTVINKDNINDFFEKSE